jgi:hypothetical protein
VLADQIHNARAAVALLHVRECECRNFGSPRSTAEQDGQNRAIT